MANQLGTDLGTGLLAAPQGAPLPPPNSVTNAMLANVAGSTIKGRGLGLATGSPQDLTGVQAGKIISAETITTLGANATTLTQSSLNGNTDGDWRLDFEINVVQNACTIGLRVNTLETNMKSFRSLFNTGAGASTTWRFGTSAGADLAFSSGDKIYGIGFLRAKSGRIRFVNIDAFLDAAGDNKLAIDGIWTDTATNITSLDFNAGVALGIGTGSFFRITRLNTTL